MNTENSCTHRNWFLALPREPWRDKHFPQPLMELLALALPGKRCRKCQHFMSHYITGVAADLGDCAQGRELGPAGTVTRWFSCPQFVNDPQQPVDASKWLPSEMP